MPTLLADGLGGLALEQVSFKPWCAARQTMAATQALKELLAEGVDAGSIARIGVAVLPPHLKMIDHGVTAGDRFSHLTSAAVPDGAGGAGAGCGLRAERRDRRDFARAVGVHGAHQGAGGRRPARRRLSASLGGACHGHDQGAPVRAHGDARAGRSGAAVRRGRFEAEIHSRGRAACSIASGPSAMFTAALTALERSGRRSCARSSVSSRSLAPDQTVTMLTVRFSISPRTWA